MLMLIAKSTNESSSASIDKVAPKFSSRQNEEVIYDMDEIFARFLKANKCMYMTDTGQMFSCGSTVLGI
jgi:hypothetical protein